jgi:type VII secretion-associated serine protease mycosin
MSRQLRRTVVGALAAGTAAAALVVPLTTQGAAWTPVSRGLDTEPAAMLPATVTAAEPVTVVTTALDEDGRPVVSSRTATDRAAAERLIRAGQDAPGAVSVELDAPVYALEAPTGTDPYRASQWDLARVQAPAAWATSTGAGVTVAVIDSGVDAGHPDLAGQVLPGIDLVAGTTGTSTDPNGHGTHVAGTVAALTGNNVGVSGFAPHARILPVRVLGASGSGSSSAVATGVTWAADQGAQVINMSLGSTAQVSALTNAIAYARAKGVVVIASAGNSREKGSPTNYPGADPGVVAVAATDSSDTYASYSNQGSYVDLAAPGSGIISTYPGGRYVSMSGTSMAAPHVAALAALLKASDPTANPDRIEQAMQSSAVDLGAAGKDADYGYGRINAVAALAALATPSTAPTAPSVPPTTTPAPATPTATPTTKPTTKPTTTPTATPTTKPTTKPATPTPTKTTPPPIVKVTPVITSDGSSRLVDYGTVVRTTFTVRAGGVPWARQPVQVCTAAKGAATFRCSHTTTSATGTVLAKHTATAPHRLYLVATATKTSNAVTSPTYSTTVQAVAAMERRSSRQLIATLTGVAGQTVRLQRLDGGTWTTVTTYRATSRYTVKKPVAGATYRIVVPDSPLVIGTVSNAVQW